MSRLTGAPSTSDERTLGTDSGLDYVRFRVQPGEVTYGQLFINDPFDTYLLRLPLPGTYRLVLSTDPANNLDASPWNTQGTSVAMGVSDATGDLVDAYGVGLTLGAGDTALVFVRDSVASDGDFFVDLIPFLGAPIHYALSLEHLPLLPGGQRLAGTDGADVLTGGRADDTLLGGAGIDSLTGGEGNDTLDGGDDFDEARYEYATGPVQVDLAAGVSAGSAGQDTLTGIEALVGSGHDDLLRGDALDNDLDGGAGHDQIEGGAGDDNLTGGPGDDRVDGGDGDDTAVYDGPFAQATITFDEATGALQVTTPSAGTDRLYHIEWLAFADRYVRTLPYTDVRPPVLTGSTPAADATAVAVDTNLRLDFDEPVQAGSGTITLRAEGGQVLATFNVRNSPALSIDDRSVVINPPANLPGATVVRVEVSAGALTDGVGNAFAGGVVQRFTTETAPVEVSIADAQAVEGAAALRFVVTLSRPATTTVTVMAGVDAVGTARQQADYTGHSAQLSFAPGQTQAEFNVPLLQDTLFESTEVLSVSLSQAQGARLSRSVASGQIVDDDNLLQGLPQDPLMGLQWYLYPGVGANVLPVWADYTGRGVRVALFDQGIDATHPDLAGQVATTQGRHAADPAVRSGNPVLEADNHGTAVAGVVAASRNGQGLVGVAHGATLVSYYSPLDETFTPTGVANVFGYARDVDVLNNSWGYAPQYVSSAPWAFLDNFRMPDFAPTGRALRELAAQGREGLGTIVVQSAGNSYRFGDDTNLHNFQNSRYIITVGATDFDGRATAYSSPGASVLVAAPGGGGNDPLSDILTTDRLGLDGYDPGDTTALRGTSFSSPVVAGVVALMLEANPGLGWRDVQALLALSARQPADSGNTWLSNGAAQWNGGGLRFDADTHDMGFGLVDARAAVRLAETWAGPARTSANLRELIAERHTPQAVPDGRGSLSQTLVVADDLTLERVEVTVDLRHSYLGDLRLLLESPSGTQSWLLGRPGVNEALPFGSSQSDINFTFSSVLHLGESALGTWRLTVFDEEYSDVGTLESWTLVLTGQTPSTDTRWTYTDDLAAAAASNRGRTALQDGTGIDTFDAAAVSSASRIDLEPGSTSRVAGQDVLIVAGTEIEHAIGGDGGDDLRGNAGPNHLRGMRGDDMLTGRAGNDHLDGGAGLDTARYTGPRARFELQPTPEGWTVTDRSGTEGVDQLTAVERLLFSDSGLALDLAPGGRAAQTAQVLNALFGAASLAVPEFVTAGLRLFDAGMALADVVALAVAHEAFASAAGGRSHAAFVNHVYRNVVGQAPGPTELAFFTSLLENGTYSQASLALLATQEPLNLQHVAVVGLAQTGLAFVPWGA